MHLQKEKIAIYYEDFIISTNIWRLLQCQKFTRISSKPQVLCLISLPAQHKRGNSQCFLAAKWMTEKQEEKRRRHPTYIITPICQHAHYHQQMFQMCLWVRKRLGVPILKLFPCVRYLNIHNCCWLTAQDLSACALVIYLLRASSPSILHNGKSF